MAELDARRKATLKGDYDSGLCAELSDRLLCDLYEKLQLSPDGGRCAYTCTCRASGQFCGGVNCNEVGTPACPAPQPQKPRARISKPSLANGFM